jgi:hypothetical protein
MEDRKTNKVFPALELLAAVCSHIPLARIDDSPLLIQVLHPLLREGRPDDAPRQVFHSHIIAKRYAVVAEDVAAGMFHC